MLPVVICVAFCVSDIGGFCFEYPNLESNSDGVAEKQVRLLPKTKKNALAVLTVKNTVSLA